jgi:hypothetical protein
MAATVVSTTHVPGGSVQTISFTGINASAGNAVVVLLSIRDAGGASYSSATWNSGSVTAADTQLDTLTDGMQLHAIAFTGLTGTQTLAITLDAFSDDIEGWAVVISNANTADVLGTAAYTASGSNASPAAATVSTDANAIVLSQARGRADLTATMAAQSGQTSIDGPQLSGNGNTIMLSSEPGAASVSSGYTFDDSAFPFVRVAVVPVNGTGGGSSQAPRSSAFMRMLMNN